MQFGKQKLLHWNTSPGFPSLRGTQLFSLFYFFCKEKVKRKLTFMYLFNLNISNIKSEAFALEYSKKKFFLKILQNSLENNCVQESFL